MKTLSTLKSVLAIVALTCFMNQAKADIIEVSVTSNQFTPASISINVGDVVHWTNTQGTHNVNGTTGSYPNNPEGFGNSVGSGWEYEFTFTIAGFYEYRCNPHFTSGMVGDITVNTVTTVGEVSATENSMNIYPVPAMDELWINASSSLTQVGNIQVAVYSLSGQQVYRTRMNATSPLKIEVGEWDPTVYLIQLSDQFGHVETGRIIVQ